MHPDPRGPGRTLLPLTQAQTAMWMRWKYAEQSSAYNNPLLFELLGDVDVQRLGAACSALVDRHDVVRARFVEIDGVPFQEIVPRERPALELRDLSTLPEPLREKRKEEMLAAALKAPFDLTREAVHRFALVRMEDRRHLLAMNIHHICADGISASILLEEIAADYEGTSPPPAVAPGIARFLEHEAAVPAEARAESERFWTGELRHARPAVDFGAIQRTDTEPSGPGAARHLFKLGAAERKAVGALARRTRSTLFTVLAAALDVLLWRCTGQADITLMYPVDIRPRELKRQFGCHINYVPLVLSLRREMTVAELIQAAVQARTRSRPHEDFPHLEISRIARKSGPPFNTAITAANFALDLFSLRGLEVRPHLVHAGGAKEDLGLLFDAQGEELALILEYRRSIWRDEVIRELGADLLHLLGQMAADESVRLGALQLRGDRPFAERFLAAEVPGAGGDLSALFEERLERAGDRVVASGPERAFSARALRGLAQGAAELLLERGVRAGDRVAVQASRSPLLLPAILGAWKIGASYVPVEPELPPARSRFILEDAAPRLVLTDAELALLREREPRGPPAELRGGEVAYVIYTSGSTGTPKGVEVTRSNLAAFLRAMEALLPVRAESRLLAVTTIGFDISLLELFLPLVAGGTVLIYPAEQVRDAFALPALLEQERVDVLQATPSFFRMLVGAGWTGKKDLVALAGGEPLEEKTAGVLLRGCRELWNLYGPTETTVWSMAARLEDASRIDLGRPIPGTSVHLLLAGGLPVPRYGRGEIWLGGAGVARGYRGLPQLTAERFAELPGLGRAYRTGDVAERTGDDAIHFVGRADGQVKIRGFRVELGEIEHRLEALAGVKKAVAVAFSGEANQRTLGAFVEAAESAAPSEHGLRAALAGSLPQYMIPSAFRFVREWPLGSSGKIDRRALERLLEEERAPGAAVSSAPGVVGPSGREVIERIYAEVLGSVPADPSLNLFELGGHSLLGARIVARLRDELGLAVPFQAFMAGSSLDGVTRLVAELASKARAPEGEPEAAPAPAASGELRLPSGSSRVLLVDQVLGRTFQGTLGRLFLIEGPLDVERLRRAVESARARFLLDRFHLEVGPPARAVPHWSAARFWNELALEAPDEEVVSLSLAWMETPLDPERGLLFKSLLVTQREDRHHLALAVHHGALDGESCHRFLRAVSAFHAEGRAEEGFSEAETVSFVASEAARVAGARDAALEHFRERLRGWSYLELGSALAPYAPDDNRRTALELPEETARALSTRARAAGCGPFAFSVALLAKALAEHTGARDVCLGVVHTLRGPPALERVFGNLTNVLPLHLRGARELELDAVAAEAQAQLAADRDRAFFPFQALLDAFPECRRPGAPPMFSVLVVKEVVGEDALALGAAAVRPVDPGFVPNSYDLTVRVRVGTDWRACFDYNATRVEAAAVAGLARSMERAIAGGGGALLSDGAPRRARVEPARPEARPRTVHPREVAAIIEEALGVPHVDLDQGFLAAGGDSLLATRAAALLRQRLGVEARGLDLLGAPSMRELVQSLAPVDAGARPPSAPPPPERVPARPGEKAMVFIHGIARLKAAYNIPVALEIEPPLDLPRLRRALDAVVAAEPALRAGFEQTAEGIVKLVRPPGPALLEEHGPADRARLGGLLAEIVRRPFDLSADPLLRAHHFSLGGGRDALLFVFHHVITDGASCGNFLRRLAAAYDGAPLDPPAPAAPPPDPAAGARRLEELLAELPIRARRAALPYARPFPRARTLEGDFYEVKLGAAQREALGEVARARGVPVSALVLSAVAFALHHASRERQLNIGVATMNRVPATEGALGLHTNTVVLPAAIDPEEQAGAALARMASALFTAVRYSDVPFQDVVSRLVESPDLGMTPLFQVFYNFIDRRIYALSTGTFRAAEIPLRPAGSKFELSFEVHDLGDAMSLVLEYSTDVYERQTVVELGELLRRILPSLGGALDWSVARLLRSVR